MCVSAIARKLKRNAHSQNDVVVVKLALTPPRATGFFGAGATKLGEEDRILGLSRPSHPYHRTDNFFRRWAVMYHIILQRRRKLIWYLSVI